MGGTQLEKFQKLSAAFRYTSLRLSEIVVRLYQLDLIRSEIARIPEADRIAEMTKDPREGNPWMWVKDLSMHQKVW